MEIPFPGVLQTSNRGNLRSTEIMNSNKNHTNDPETENTFII